MRYIKYPQKNKIRNQAVIGLDAVLRNRVTGSTALAHVVRIKKEIQTLEDSTSNPANRERLQEATDVLDKAIAMVRGKALPVHHEPLDQPAIIFGNRSFHQITGAGVWRMTTSPLEFQVTAEGNEPAPGSFRPELSPENSEEWLTADPDAIKLTGKGLILEKGTAGNYLLTRKSDHGKCSMSIMLAAFENTEAYLTLHAHQEPDGWHAITSRVVCTGGKVQAGSASADFQTQERGQLVARPPGKAFLIRFEIDDDRTDRVFIGGQQTSSSSHGGQTLPAPSGSVGLFVKSGKVLIESLHISEK